MRLQPFEQKLVDAVNGTIFGKAELSFVGVPPNSHFIREFSTMVR
jgi:hypothetical protein